MTEQYMTKQEIEAMIAAMETTIMQQLDTRLTRMEDGIDRLTIEQQTTNRRLNLLRDKTSWVDVGGASTMDYVILSIVVLTGVVTVAVQFSWGSLLW